MEHIVKTYQGLILEHKAFSIAIEVIKAAAIIYVLISTFSVLSA